MPIIGLMVTGTAFFAGLKVLRRQFPPTTSLATTLRATGGSPTPATGGVVDPDEAAIPPATTPVAALRSLVMDDENRKVSVILLTSATAWTHIALGLQIPYPLLILNGVGYLVLLTGHYFVPQLAPYRDQTRDALSAYTGTTIVGYFATCTAAGVIGPAGLLNKLIEVGLMGVLWFDPGSATHTQDDTISSGKMPLQALDVAPTQG